MDPLPVWIDGSPPGAVLARQCGRTLMSKVNGFSSLPVNTSSGLLHVRPPGPMHESLPRRKQQAIGYKPNDDNDKHHADDLFHGVELAPVAQEVSWSEAAEDRDVRKFPRPTVSARANAQPCFMPLMPLMPLTRNGSAAARPLTSIRENYRARAARARIDAARAWSVAMMTDPTLARRHQQRAVAHGLAHVMRDKHAIVFGVANDLGAGRSPHARQMSG